MLHVISRDGTKIAYEKTGTGPALLIIGGALADHHNYTSLAISLADQFEVYNYDRRGRGQSTDTTLYAVERAAKVTVPTLILSAKDMPETAQALVGIIHNASFQPMESSAHELNPAYIAEDIVRFTR